jgi:hypothetical protein
VTALPSLSKAKHTKSVGIVQLKVSRKITLRNGSLICVLKEQKLAMNNQMKFKISVALLHMALTSIVNFLLFGVLG